VTRRDTVRSPPEEGCHAGHHTSILEFDRTGYALSLHYQPSPLVNRFNLFESDSPPLAAKELRPRFDTA